METANSDSKENSHLRIIFSKHISGGQQSKVRNTQTQSLQVQPQQLLCSHLRILERLTETRNLSCVRCMNVPPQSRNRGSKASQCSLHPPPPPWLPSDPWCQPCPHHWPPAQGSRKRPSLAKRYKSPTTLASLFTERAPGSLCTPLNALPSMLRTGSSLSFRASGKSLAQGGPPVVLVWWSYPLPSICCHIGLSSSDYLLLSKTTYFFELIMPPPLDHKLPEFRAPSVSPTLRPQDLAPCPAHGKNFVMNGRKKSS